MDEQPTPKFTFSTLLFQIFVLIVPLFYLPIFRESIEFPKYLLLYAVSILTLVLFGIQIIRTRQITLKISWIDLPIILLAIVYLVSWALNPGVKWEVWAFPNSIGTVLSLTIIYFFMRQLLSTLTSKIILIPLIISANIVALSVTVQSLISLLNLKYEAPGFWAIFTNPLVSLTGNLVYSILFILVGSVMFLRVVTIPRIPRVVSTLISLIPLLIPLAAIIAGTVSVISNRQAFPLQSYNASWVVTAETYKQPKALLYGIGPSQYELAYLRGKPAWVSNTQVWNTAFSQGANHWFTIASEIGLIGLAAFVLLVLRILTLEKRPHELIALLIILTFLPSQISLMFFLYIVLMGIASQNYSIIRIPLGMVINPQSKLKIAPLAIFIGVFLIAGSLYLGYFGTRIAKGEYYFTQGLRSANKIQDRISNQDNAVLSNPYMSSYYAGRSQTQLAVAFSLSRQDQLTDDQRANLVKIIKTSSENAKQSIRIRPSKSNWENLAQIYRSVIGADKQAIQWTVAAYQNALQVDPFNPVLRLRLGQVLFQAKSYQSALQQFQNARTLKTDFVAGWYWEANANKQLNNIELARTGYQKALNLLEPNSEEYQTITKELESLQTTPQNPTNPDQNTQGEQVQTPLDLPQDTGPQNLPTPKTTNITPTPTPIKETPEASGGSTLITTTPSPIPTVSPTPTNPVPPEPTPTP